MTRTSLKAWAESKPFVSVVLPVRNEGRFIRRCLEAVQAQDYPADRMEIIVADGMSTDDTPQIVESMRHGRVPIQLIPNRGKIVPTGLNAAIAAARGEVIVRVDGHCEIAADYVSRCVQHLGEGVDAVGGPLDTVGETLLARAIALAMSSSFGVGNAAFRTVNDRNMLVDTVAFPAYTREVVDQLGPFDEELVRNQDDEYNSRLRKRGGRILLASDVRSKYFSRSALRPLWRQYFQYGYWKVRVLQKHPRQMSIRQLVPPLFVTALTASLIALPLTSAGYWLLAAVAGPYLAAAAIASVWLSRRDLALSPLLPVIFAILHIGYGAGFIEGLVSFRHRWRESSAI